jgi:hemolysin D
MSDKVVGRIDPASRLAARRGGSIRAASPAERVRELRPRRSAAARRWLTLGYADRARDREFLPAALEILETPPSPVRIWLLQAICALVAIAVAWMFIGRIDVIAIAQGKVEPAGRVKLVQPLESGKVREVLVSNGATVREGDPVVILDGSEARAEETALAAALASYRAEVARRKAGIAAAQAGNYEPPVVDWPRDVAGDILARESRVLSSDLALLASSLASFAAQRRQREAERDRLADMIESQEKMIAIEEQRVDIRSTLESQKLGSKLSLYDALESLQNQRSTLTQQKGQLAEALASLDVLDRDAAKTTRSFLAENSQKLADAERLAQDVEQKLAKARAKSSHMILRASASGTVQALSITSLGQVLMPGEEVMRIVPDGAELEIEAYMPNRDIGFIKVGQEAVVKIESFPFARYGSLPARVKRVSREAIPEPDAQQQEADPARSSRSTLAAGAQRVQNLVFPVTLVLERTSIAADGAEIPVRNGMAVTVEVKTGQRRIIDYIFSPLVEVASTAMKER